MKELIKDKHHVCQIFDLVSISSGKYRCQTCKKIHTQEGFEAIKKSAPHKFCYCDGNMKRMQVHVPHPVSGYETHTIYYCCIFCGSKYMFHKFKCDMENCNNYCDISEVYCRSCRQNMK